MELEPAFPHPGGSADFTVQKSHLGMTLRDYFAVHCDQPGRAEIAKEAGVRMEGYFVLTDTEDGPQKTPWDEWWAALSQEGRFYLYAKVRYGMADAMLAARAAISLATSPPAAEAGEA